MHAPAGSTVALPGETGEFVRAVTEPTRRMGASPSEPLPLSGIAAKDTDGVAVGVLMGGGGGNTMKGRGTGLPRGESEVNGLRTDARGDWGRLTTCAIGSVRGLREGGRGGLDPTSAA